VKKLATDQGIHKRFTQAEIAIRNALDDHDMMIEKQQQSGLPGENG